MWYNEANTSGTDPAATAAVKAKVANAVEGFLNGLMPTAITFAAAQLHVTDLPKRVTGALTQLQNAPRQQVEKALTALVAKAKAALGLDATNAKEYVGLIGTPLVRQGNGRDYRIWVVNQNGKPVVMRAGPAGTAAPPGPGP